MAQSRAKIAGNGGASRTTLSVEALTVDEWESAIAQMQKKSTPLTDEQKRFVEKHIGSYTQKQIATVIGATIDQVMHYARKIR